MPRKEKMPYTISKDLAADPTDFTKNGQCSRCGGCCSSVLPLSDQDIARLKTFAAVTGFKPKMPEGRDVIYNHCPFLVDGPETGAKSCAAYGSRPDVCRSFICSNTNIKNAKAWMDAYKNKDFPEPRNAWLVFNMTGLRMNGEDVPYDKAPLCRIATADRQAFEFHVGRPASFMLNNGEYVPPSLVIGIYKDGLHVFNGAKHAMEFIPFERIAEVLTDACRVDYIEDENKKDKEDGHDA